MRLYKETTEMETETQVHRSFEIGQRWASATDEEIAWFKKYLAQQMSLPEKFQVAVSFGGWMGGNTLEVRIRGCEPDDTESYLLCKNGMLLDCGREDDLEDECVSADLCFDSSELEHLPMKCCNGHEMVSTRVDSGWSCDGIVCKNSRCKSIYQGDLAHLRCAECNYDMCWRCVRLANEISTKTPTTREEYADLLEKFGSRELKKRVLKEQEFTPWEPESDRVCSS
jgi:hypothetical protein